MSKPNQAGAMMPVKPDDLETLDSIAERVRGVVADAKGKIAEAFALGVAVNELRRMITPLVPHIRPLVGSALGFKTDRDTSDKGPYSDAVIADALIVAVARGFRWTGNEFNVIGGNFYGTKSGYARLVGQLPGLTDLDLAPGIPRMGDGGAVVKCVAKWKLDGAPMSIERDFAVRLNNGQGADAAIGKATRKLLAAIHARVTGSAHSAADIDAEDLDTQATGTGRAAALADKLAGTRAPALPAATATEVPEAGRLFNNSSQNLPD